MEDYAAKMQTKSDAALREYVTGHAQYLEAAVLAALDELRRRDQPAPEEAELRPALEAAVAQTGVLPSGPPAPVSSPAGTAKAPALYSPLAIGIFSIMPIATMLGGGVLLGLNLYRVGRRRAALGLAVFVVAYLVVGSYVLSWAVLQAGLSPLLGGMLFNLPAVLVYLRWFWPRYLGSAPYRNRSLLPPFVVCFALMWGLQKALPYLISQQPPAARRELEKLMGR